MHEPDTELARPEEPGDHPDHVHGPLRPGELAEVAVLGDLALALEVVGWFAPTFVSGAFQALAILPFAVLASRHRLRAGTIAVVGAALVAGLVGGLGVVIQTSLAGVIGISIGVVQRRRWPPVAAIGLTALFAGLPAAVLTLLADSVSPGFRKLSFDQVRVAWRAVAHVLEHLGDRSVAASGTSVLDWLISHWWLTLPAVELVALMVIAAVCLQFRHILSALTRSAIPPYHGAIASRVPGAPAPRPLPVALEDVSFRYPGAAVDALDGVTVSLGERGLVAVVGDNGSGKSTLVRLLAGRFPPTAGRIDRHGRSGYGEPGGTAMIFQRPESQVLGVRVRDDLWWGLPPGERGDPDVLLRRVGLEGLGDRETSTLSGGQLQRLAVASALARRPELLVSDESTAMVDDEGRAELLELYRDLALDTTAIVHVTHRTEEAEVAERVLALRRGRLVAESAIGSGGPVPAESEPSAGPPEELGTTALAALAPPAWSSGTPTPGRELLATLRGVGHVYSAGSPWQHRALEGVDLDIFSGDGIVVTGANGSGKTTLAWILGGLLEPSEGQARLGATPIGDVPARVAVAFQHARLQLLKPRVLADVMIGLTGDRDLAKARARAALGDVGLDPDEFAERRVDELSGGEQRRVALAGLLVREPELLVLDEPLAGLDRPARAVLSELLERLRVFRRVATVVVSHDLDRIGELGSRVVRLDGGRLVSDEVVG